MYEDDDGIQAELEGAEDPEPGGWPGAAGSQEGQHHRQDSQHGPGDGRRHGTYAQVREHCKYSQVRERCKFS